MMDWLKRIFVPGPPSTDADEAPMEECEEEEPSFVFNEHMRIVLAIVFALFSAGFLWWILA